MTSVDTGAVIDWVTLSTPEFVGWTRMTDLALPYPLSTNDVPYIDAPERAEVTRLLGQRQLGTSPVLEAARAAMTAPRLIVYAVRVSADEREAKYVAIAGRDEENAVLVLLDDRQVSVRIIADTELAAGVAGSLPPIAGLQFPSVEVPVSALQAIDSLVSSGATQRTVRAQMQHAGLPPQLASVQEHTPPGPVPSGVLGAVAFGLGDQDATSGRHASRSASWREFPAGAVLQVERGVRHGEQMMLLAPLTTQALFRAAVDAVTSSYEGG